LQELALRLSAFADVLNQHATRLMQENSISAQSLREAAAAFTSQSAQVSRELVQSVGAQAREVIELRAGHGLRQSVERLASAATQAEAAAGSLQRKLQRLGAAQQSLVWKSGLALLLGSLLAVAGSGYLVGKNHQALKQAEFPTAVANAMRSAR
ncbi:MAG: hypothetical protein ABWZ08_11375, partial [Pseudoxanthomonas sp.]